MKKRNEFGLRELRAWEVRASKWLRAELRLRKFVELQRWADDGGPA